MIRHLLGGLLAAGLMTSAASAEPRSTAPAQATSQSAYTVFMLVKTNDPWLKLTPEQRFAFLGSDIEPILKGHPGVRLRFFDTEFFNSDVTDVLVWETSDLKAYQMVIEALRESRFWDHYFQVVSILPGIENAYASNYNVKPVGR